jgi:hypothetical protein
MESLLSKCWFKRSFGFFFSYIGLMSNSVNVAGKTSVSILKEDSAELKG